MKRRDLLGAALIGALTAVTARAESENAPHAPTLLPDRLALADAAVAAVVERAGVPGAVLLVARHDGVALRRAYGNAGLRPSPRPMKIDTIFDLASVTKCVATATAIMTLIETGRVALDTPVARYLPAFGEAGGDRAWVTIRHLLTHSAGLPAGGAFAGKTVTLPEIVRIIAESRRVAPPGTRFLYSDFSAITLGAVVQAVTGIPLDVYCRERIFMPLGMTDTGFRPDSAHAARCAATTSGDDTPERRGRVHDPTAAALGGVSGNAGLFSTADDLARFCQMMLNRGTYNGARILRPETVALMTAKASPFAGEDRALGWDIDSAYNIRGDLPRGSYGHTGFTGTSLWLDPTTQTFIILLTNAVHSSVPTASRAVIGLRRRISSIVASAIPELNLPAPGTGATSSIASVPRSAATMPVLTGLASLAADDFRLLAGRKVGIVCNHTALDRQGRHIVNLLAESKKVDLVALFGPEHSIRGDVDASANDTRDARTGLPVYSLYNLNVPREQRYRPTAEQLAGIDTLIYDIQDIGARYYTYIATLGYCMEAAAQHNIRMVVLDRPNPLGGDLVEGPLLDPGYAGQFIAYHTMPITHGLTVGELANLYNAERKIGAQVEVVRLQGWERRMAWDDDGLPWTNPSPNIRNVREVFLYPGVGFLEYLPLSVGRGTDMPFENIGAPYIDPLVLAAELSARRLPGVSFVPVRFTPSSSVFKGQLCGGVQINLWDRSGFRPSVLGLHLADALIRHYPDHFPADVLVKMNVLVGSAAVPEQLLRGTPPEQVAAGWTADAQTWRHRRAPFLLY